MTHTISPGSGQHGLPEHSDRDSSNLYKKHGALLTLKYNVPKIGSDVQFIHGAATLECCKPQSISVPVESKNNLTVPIPVKASQTRNVSKHADVQPLPLEILKWLTIKQTAARYQTHTEKALWHLVSSAEAYQRHPKAGLKSNGFFDCICRPSGQRKVLINAQKFEEWLSPAAMGEKS